MATVAFEGNNFSLRIDDQDREFVYTGNEVLIVPLTAEGEVLLTIETSPAFGVPTLILPGGETEGDETHSETALRELREEIGQTAKKLEFLGEMRPFSKYLTVRSFLYLARELTPSQLKGDEAEKIQIQRTTLATFEQLIEDGFLLDARVIAALYMVRRFLAQEQN